MKWPYMFEWLFDMALYGNPDANIRFGVNHGTSIFIPLAFFMIIGYCYTYHWWYRRKHPDWRGRIELIDPGESANPGLYSPTPSPRFVATKVMRNLKSQLEVTTVRLNRDDVSKIRRMSGAGLRLGTQLELRSHKGHSTRFPTP